MPLGFAGLSAFNDVTLPEDLRETRLLGTKYHYKLLQQGLTAKVSCKETESTPIERTKGEAIGVTFANGGELLLQNYTINTST